MRTLYAPNVILGVVDVAAGAFVFKPLSCGDMMIDTKMCQNPHSAQPFNIRKGISFPLRKKPRTLRSSEAQHTYIEPLAHPPGFVVYKLVIFLQYTTPILNASLILSL